MKVNTAYLNGTIEGTEFIFELRGKKAVLTVLEGTIVADNSLGNVTLESGQSATGEPDKAPVRRIVAKPRDGVQWALHYPPVLAGGGSANSPTGQAAALLKCRARRRSAPPDRPRDRGQRGSRARLRPPRRHQRGAEPRR